MLRERLENYPFISILNENNHGTVTLFRVYPKGVNAKETFKLELKDPSYQEKLEEYNSYNFGIFDYVHKKGMQGKGVLLSLTDAYRYAEYPDGPPIAAIMSFIMSLWTDLNAVDLVIQQVLEAQMQME